MKEFLEETANYDNTTTALTARSAAETPPKAVFMLYAVAAVSSTSRRSFIVAGGASWEALRSRNAVFSERSALWHTPCMYV